MKINEIKNKLITVLILLSSQNIFALSQDYVDCAMSITDLNFNMMPSAPTHKTIFEYNMIATPHAFGENRRSIHFTGTEAKPEIVLFENGKIYKTDNVTIFRLSFNNVDASNVIAVKSSHQDQYTIYEVDHYPRIYTGILDAHNVSAKLLAYVEKNAVHLDLDKLEIKNPVEITKYEAILLDSLEKNIHGITMGIAMRAKLRSLIILEPNASAFDNPNYDVNIHDLAYLKDVACSCSKVPGLADTLSYFKKRLVTQLPEDVSSIIVRNGPQSFSNLTEDAFMCE